MMQTAVIGDGNAKYSNRVIALSASMYQDRVRSGSARQVRGSCVLEVPEAITSWCICTSATRLLMSYYKNWRTPPRRVPSRAHAPFQVRAITKCAWKRATRQVARSTFLQSCKCVVACVPLATLPSIMEVRKHSMQPRMHPQDPRAQRRVRSARATMGYSPATVRIRAFRALSPRRLCRSKNHARGMVDRIHRAPCFPSVHF